MKYLIVFMTFLISAGAFAQTEPQTDDLEDLSAICFNSVSSYDAIKAKLPKMLQGGSYYASADSWSLKGGFRIVPVGNTFRADAKMNSLFAGVINQSQIISQACVTGDQLSISLTNGTKDVVTIRGDGLTIQGYDFYSTDEAGYEKATSDISLYDDDDTVEW